MERTPDTFIVKKRVGLCIVNTKKYTITYPNGITKQLQLWELSHEQDLYKYQNSRGYLL